MAIPAYLYLTDEQGKPIKGSVSIKGREDSIEVLEFNHKIHIPADSNTGKLKGTRNHHALEIVKEVDVSSPYLYRAVTSGQLLNTVKIDWYKIGNDGKEVPYFKTELFGVKVISVQGEMYNIKDPSKEVFNHLERVELAYEKITWTYLDGNHTHTDSWEESRG
ncbi:MULTISPECIES: type VI secretion system tube protein TssD [unclassified Gilliamella]|uniref:type VI secretion system tube protein TssD n=1 Tax=unclassified Gilliamella TaxID=2685620 RepID=UPI001C6A15F2|nr:type VI secretion system tube protein TssD [Gilliamella sp. ESL0441]QYN44752.1 type VI secretion system tube protein Hcp [Gilliamella sp. ESL0441]